MNILIFEYITGGGLANQTLPTGLVREGEMMLRAVARDFVMIPNMQVSILKDYRLTINVNAVNEIAITPETSSIQEIESMVDELDALLIIAPETDNILASLCERFEKQALILLNSSVDSIKLTADKYACYKHLHQYAIEQIPSYKMDELDDSLKENSANKYIIKSKDGVGCEDLMILNNLNHIGHTFFSLEKDNYIIQPFIQGRAASLSLLCWDGDCLLLTANEQCIEEKNNSFSLIKCRVNSLDKEEHINFAKEILAALPGLRGYIGIDMLVRDEKILLVEINPRLTISYAGIASAIGVNPAHLMLHCFVNNELPDLKATNNEIIEITLEAEYAA